MSDVDVAIVGAGHNALVCGGYLARAGYRVAVLERRRVPGGAAATEELLPGYRFDVGGSLHQMINLTPIVDELGLGPRQTHLKGGEGAIDRALPDTARRSADEERATGWRSGASRRILPDWKTHGWSGRSGIRWGPFC